MREMSIGAVEGGLGPCWARPGLASKSCWRRWADAPIVLLICGACTIPGGDRAFIEIGGAICLNGLDGENKAVAAA
jgi:hypothetical protein